MSKTKKVLDEIRGVIGFILIVTAVVIGLFALIPVVFLYGLASIVLVEKDREAVNGTIEGFISRANKFVKNLEVKND